MNKRKIFIYVTGGLAALIAIASVAAYFILKPEKPWMAFFTACCGGILVVNLLFSMFLVNRNFRKKP